MDATSANMGDRTDPEDFVTIPGEVFTIDRKILGPRSAVFRKAFEDADARQSKRINVTLRGGVCTPRTFSVYQEYVESGELNLFDKDDPDPHTVYLDDLIPIYALAWQLEDYTAANFIMDLIVQKTTRDVHEPVPYNIAKAYKSIGPAVWCPLKRLMIDFQVHDSRLMHEWPYTSSGNKDDAALVDFFQDVMEEYRSLTRMKRGRGEFCETDNIVTFSKHKPQESNPCHNHVHNEDHLECTTREVILVQEDKEAEEDNEEDEEDEEDDEEVGDNSKEVEQENVKLKRRASI